MKVSIFTSLIECKEKASIKQIGLREEDLLNDVKLKAKELLVAGIMQGNTKEETMLSITDCLKDIDERIVEYPNVIKATQEKYVSLFQDMCEYTYSLLLTHPTLVPGKRYKVEFPKPLNFRGMEIPAVEGAYDFIMANAEEAVAVTIHAGRKNPYKPRGRKITTTTQYSPSLLFKWKALSELYSDVTLKSEDWYLLPSDKECGNFQKGNRICSYVYTEDIWKTALNAILASAECHECKGCYYESTCQMPQVREYGVEEEDIKKTAPKFTAEQKAAIEKRDGVYEIIAVAGSGKTMVLTHRAVQLINSGVKGERIVMITFTKKAAAEMKSRVQKMVQPDESLPVTATFHSFAFDIISKYPVYFGGVLKLATDGDKRKLIKKLLKDYPVIPDMNYEASGEFSVAAQIYTYLKQITDKGEDDFRKKHSKFPEEKLAAIIEFCKAVNETLKAEGYITYDDMCPLVSKALAKFPALREEVCALYDYIMVDEFQDTSKDQYDMILALTKYGNGNLMVVGDDDQSIYKFRGGDARFFKELEKDFPNCEKILLGNNFRCNNEICACASTFVSGVSGRLPKEIKGSKEGNKPYYKREATMEDLLTFVKKLLSGKRTPGDIAIQAHNNSELVKVNEYLSARGVKCSRPKDYLKEDGVFLRLYDLMNYYYNDSDFSLYRLLKAVSPSIVLPDKHDRDNSYSANLYQYEEEGSEVRLALEQIEHAIDLFDELDVKLSKLLSTVGEKIGLPGKHKVYDTLTELAEEKGAVSLFGDGSLFELISDIVEFSDESRVGYAENKDEVQLLTSHDGKGKQYDSVIVWGMEKYGFDDAERNLMYVAATRAKNTLIFMEGPLSADGFYEGYKECKDYVQLL